MSGERLIIEIHGLPNPSTPFTFNPNVIEIKIFNSLDELLFISNSAVNYAEPITFNALTHTFVINEY